MESVPLDLSVRGKQNWCFEHDLPYAVWALEERKFFCHTCILERDIQSAICPVADALPAVKAHIAEKVAEANKKVIEDLKVIEDFGDQCRKKLVCTRRYKEEIQTLEDCLCKAIAESEVLKLKRRNDRVAIGNVEHRGRMIKSETDMGLGVSSCDALFSLCQPSSLPALPPPQSKLYVFLCSYIYSCYFKSKPGSKLEDGGQWIVDNENFHAALSTVLDRKPELLIIRSNHIAENALSYKSLASIALKLMNCEVHLNQYHSLFKAPQKRDNDRIALEYFVNNKDVHLLSFYGYLNAAGIKKLPTTIQHLGLSIYSEADSIAVSDLRPWKNLQSVDVSVGRSVYSCDLRALSSVRCRALYFPSISDYQVNRVKPAIEALLQGRKFNFLVLPLSRVTAMGVYRLFLQLQDLQIDHVCIEVFGSGIPNETEKARIANEWARTYGRPILSWDLNFLYENLSECFQVIDQMGP